MFFLASLEKITKLSHLKQPIRAERSNWAVLMTFDSKHNSVYYLKRPGRYVVISCGNTKHRPPAESILITCCCTERSSLVYSNFIYKKCHNFAFPNSPEVDTALPWSPAIPPPSVRQIGGEENMQRTDRQTDKDPLLYSQTVQFSFMLWMLGARTHSRTGHLLGSLQLPGFDACSIVRGSLRFGACGCLERDD